MGRANMNIRPTLPAQAVPGAAAAGARPESAGAAGPEEVAAVHEAADGAAEPAAAPTAPTPELASAAGAAGAGDENSSDEKPLVAARAQRHADRRAARRRQAAFADVTPLRSE
eukprot:3186577-Pyramimonas_sp.AAC.1